MSEDKIHYQRIGDLPVVVCVLEAPDGLLGVGFSMSNPARFDERFARRLAFSNAHDRLATLRTRRAEMVG